MEKVNYLKHVSFAYCLALVVGVVFSRILGWDGLMKDVGTSGAWLVSTIFHLIYAFFIVTGILTNIFIISRIKKHINIKPIYFSAVVAIILCDIGLYFSHNLSFVVIVVLLFFVGAISSAIFQLTHT